MQTTCVSSPVRGPSETSRESSEVTQDKPRSAEARSSSPSAVDRGRLLPWDFPCHGDLSSMPDGLCLVHPKVRDRAVLGLHLRMTSAGLLRGRAVPTLTRLLHFFCSVKVAGHSVQSVTKYNYLLRRSLVQSPARAG